MVSQPATFDIGRDAPLTFTGPEQCLAWAESELDAWKWLSDPRLRPVQNVTNNIAEQIQNRIRNIHSAANSWISNQATQPLAQAVKSAYNDSKIPLSSDPVFKLAKYFIDQDRPETALAAVAAHSNKINLREQSISLAVWEGIVAAALVNDKISPETPRAVSESLQALSTQFTQSFADAEREFAQRLRSFDEKIDEARTRLATVEQETKDHWGKVSAERLGSIKATEDTYKEQMRLQAPADYWTRKGREHRLAARTARWWMIGYAVIGSLLLIAFLVWLLQRAVDTPHGDTAIYLKFAAVGAVATTIALWVGRVLLRIFLSERHLATDAEERVTMVMTYLALANEDKVADADRALVLSALFKSAADGIVRDDSTPDTSIAAILARGLDRHAPGR